MMMMMVVIMMVMVVIIIIIIIIVINNKSTPFMAVFTCKLYYCCKYSFDFMHSLVYSKSVLIGKHQITTTENQF